ncbi:DUF2294 domain-containing protein [Thermobrachium celere]|uniref:Na+-translocating membrane potential-generating system MpsC domain-containing protein n=1 Tax=Thermobrachium celere DSM 8682 TaxID=941824 RepID=R7RN92_9CLOT|nr:DUF2294 domain-containing protein [Thermobrachium celere]GFR35896.1 hypothetical protein TCEA9_17080 [Thermobrachium celere]CDF57499.1 unknown [Thermobrachium celere DSM 8682]
MSLKGNLEMKISNALMHFEKEEIGRGAEEAMAHIFKDMIIVRLKKVLTPAEKRLAQSPEGRKTIKEFRYMLEDVLRSKLEAIIEDIVKVKVVSIHCDISTKTGEYLMVFVMEKDVESLFKE